MRTRETAPPPESTDSAPLRPWELWTLLALLLLAVGVRSYQLGAKNLWVDELLTTLAASGTGQHDIHALPRNAVLDPPPMLVGPSAAPTRAVLRPDPSDINPPTYPFLLRLWAKFFGWREAALRSLGVACSVAAVLFLWAAVRETSRNAATALWAAAITAAAQAQIDMAREVRSYALLAALAAAACWATARLARRGPNVRRTFALFALCLAMPLVHYFGVITSAALGLFALTAKRGPARRAILVATVGATLLFLIAWSPVLRMQRQGAAGAGNSDSVDDLPGPHLLHVLRNVGVLPARYLCDPLPKSEWTAAAMWVGVLVPLALKRRRPDLWLWALWIPIQILPSLSTDLLKGSMSLLRLRYTFIAGFGLYALLPMLVQRMPPLLRHGLPAAALLTCLLSLTVLYANPETTYRDLGRAVHRIGRRGDVTVFYSNNDPVTLPNIHLMTAAYYGAPFHGPIVVMNRPTAPPELIEQLRRFPAVLLVGDWSGGEPLAPGQRYVGLPKTIAFRGQVARVVFDPPPTTRAAPTPDP